MARVKKDSTEYVDSEAYLAKKATFAKLTTVYGKHAVREALQNHPSPVVVRLLLANELGDAAASELVQLARKHQIEVRRLPWEKLSRITKNHHEDQGVAADLDVELLSPLVSWMDHAPAQAKLLAVCGVTTPANIGIIIRSVAAAGLAGIVLTEAGCPAPTLPLIIKASAGNIFRTRIFSVRDIEDLLRTVVGSDWSLFALATAPHATSLFEHRPPSRAIYLLGNESMGLPDDVLSSVQGILSIPLANGVESLNVAAAGTLVAYHVR